MLKQYLVAVSLLLVAALLGACSNPDSDSIDAPAFPIELTTGRIEAGELIYSQNCASCHGPVQGPAAIDSAPVHGDAGPPGTTRTGSFSSGLWTARLLQR